MKHLRSLFLLVLVAVAVVAAGASCERYEAPPRPVVEGLSSGVLTDPRAPIVIDFGTPVDESTLFVKVALAETDAEGNLLAVANSTWQLLAPNGA